MGLPDSARHFIICHSTQYIRVDHALDDEVGNICQALP